MVVGPSLAPVGGPVREITGYLGVVHGDLAGNINVSDLGLDAQFAPATAAATFAQGTSIQIAEDVDANGNRTLTFNNTKAGVTTNTVPSAGQLGEDASVIVAQSAAVALTTAVAANIASVVLQPGVWEVGGAAVGITGSATSVTSACAGISTASATAPGYTQRAQWLGRGAGMSAGDSIMVYPSQRFAVASGATMTVYLVGLGIFSGGTLSMYGELRVRRVF
jgi:hypothetical protein